MQFYLQIHPVIRQKMQYGNSSFRLALVKDIQIKHKLTLTVYFKQSCTR